MKKTCKKLIAIVLALLMLGSVVPTMAFAVAEDTQEHISESKNVLESILNDIKAFIQSILDFFRRLFGCEPDPIPVAEITADKDAIDLIIGDTDKITATVLPTDATNPAITFASSDEAVVTVDNEGNVTAIGAGKAVITITSNDDETKTFTVNVKVEKPDPEGYFPVTTIEELKAALSTEEKLIVIKNDLFIDSAEDSIVIPADKDITINAKGYKIARVEGGEEAVIFNVSANAKLTLEDVIVDGGAVWTGEVNEHLLRGTVNSGIKTTGAIVAAANNACVVLNGGTVLQNNDGANAVSIATRGGGSLTLNGAHIINNTSAAGAIWGGDDVTINEGTIINGNNATSIGGAFRMVDGKNAITFTMNGGEINHNLSNGTGGAIWGGNRATYIFNGGEIAYNHATAGGAIWTGTYEKYTISGTFKLHDNTSTDLGAAIRFCDHTSLTMIGGSVYNNKMNGESYAFYLNNNSASITGGKITDSFSYSGGLGLTWGMAEVDGVINYNLGTNHKTAYLAKEFNTLKFKVTDSHISLFNFKPASDYVYTEGDEAKLICMNEGYETYWDTATSTFRLKAV